MLIPQLFPCGKIVTPGTAGGSSYAGKALFYWLRLKALRVFLHLQRHLLTPLTPLPYSKQAENRKQSCTERGPIRQEAAPLPYQSPARFMGSHLCCFITAISRIVGRVEFAFLLTAKAFLNSRHSREFSNHNKKMEGFIRSPPPNKLIS